MNTLNPCIKVDLVFLPNLKPNVELRVREYDPESGLQHEVRVKGAGKERLRLKLRGWSGHQFDLEVDLANATARLLQTVGLPAADALTKSAFEECVELLCAT